MKDERKRTYENSISPFTDDIREAVLGRIRSLPDETNGMTGWNLRRVLFTLYYYGPHPEVLVHPGKRRLHVREGWLRWFRPKTGAFVGMPVVKETEPWLAQWVSSLKDPTTHKFSERRYQVKENNNEWRTRTQDVCYQPLSRLVSEQMDEWGFVGYTARSFRHDRARRIFLVRGELADVEQLIAVTPTVAVRYARKMDPTLEAALRNEGNAQ